MFRQTEWRGLRHRIHQFKRIGGSSLRKIHAGAQTGESTRNADGRQTAVRNHARQRVAIRAGEHGPRIEPRVLRRARHRIPRETEAEIVGGRGREAVTLVQHSRCLRRRPRVAARQRSHARRGVVAPELRPACGNLIPCREPVFQPDQPRVVMIGVTDISDIRLPSGHIRQRIKGQQFSRDRIGHGGPLRDGRRQRAGYRRRALIKAFPGAEKVSPPAVQRTAKRGAELIPVERILYAAQFVRKEIGRIQHGIAEKLKHAAMKFLAAAARDHVHLPAGLPALFRLDSAGLHRELLHGIRDTEQVQRLVRLRIGVADTVQQINIRLRPHPVDAEPGALCAGGRGDAARNQHREVEKLPAI